MTLAVELCEILGESPKRLEALHGGCVGEVYLVELPDERRYVAKVDTSGEGRLDVEGWMLEYLGSRAGVPVPEVRHSSPELLVMQWMPGQTGCKRGAEDHAAELLLRIHSVRGMRFGLERDTLIGGLHQDNTESDSWLEFFAERRVLPMARRAHELGRIGKRSIRQAERLAAGLSKWLVEPDQPRLLHGDLWSGNVISDGIQVTALIDPALYYGHPEVELAFITLFRTFGNRFFDVYRQGAAIDEDFLEARRHIYNVYPLLVHSVLFDSGYSEDVKNLLDRFVG